MAHAIHPRGTRFWRYPGINPRRVVATLLGGVWHRWLAGNIIPASTTTAWALRGTGPPLQRGEQRGGGRAPDPARRGPADGEAGLPAHRRPGQLRHLPALRRRLRHRRHADRSRGDPSATRPRARQGGRHPPVRPGDQRRDLRHLQGRPAAARRRRGADNIVGGPEHSTLSNDAFPSREFDFMLSNPPCGKSWKTELERMGGKRDMHDPRFLIEHAGDPEYSPGDPFQRRPDAVSGQQALQDEAKHRARQPHRRGAQR